jgi:hypothetical protein
MNPNVESGGSQPHVFDCPEGPYLVKASNNPQGKRVLPNELLGGLCLDWLGVHHPPPATVDLPSEVLAASPGAVFTDGTPLAAEDSFGSELWQSDPQGAVDVALIINVDDVAGTLAFDTWIQPFDGRQYRVRASAQSPGRYDFIPVDQGCSFGNPNWTAAGLAGAPAPTVPAPPLPLTRSDVQPFIERLRDFTHGDAERMVEQPPEDWLDDAERTAVADYMTIRAPQAATALEVQFPEPGGGS